MKELNGGLRGVDLRLAVVVARFNPTVTDRLLRGCVEALRDCGVADDALTVVRVPGAFELPLICDRLAAQGTFDAVIALGAVIRGETAHFEFISAECARGLGQVALNRDCPVVFGVLTAETGEQALVRADPAQKNKGREVALAAIEMANLTSSINERV